MKKFLLTILMALYLVPTMAHALSAEECTACDIAVVVKLGAMTQAEIYNPSGGSFESTIILERPSGTVMDKVTVKWIVIEPVEEVTETEPVEP